MGNQHNKIKKNEPESAKQQQQKNTQKRVVVGTGREVGSTKDVEAEFKDRK